MDFLWRKVSEEEKEKIKKEAKQIMDSFAKALSKVGKTQEGIFGFCRRKKQTRKESKAEKCSSSFRKIFFENAPQKDNDWIVAEKGKWK